MNPRLADALLIAFAFAAFGVAGSMDMQDADAAIAVPVVRQAPCREPLYLRVAATADEVAGRCDQSKGVTK